MNEFPVHPIAIYEVTSSELTTRSCTTLRTDNRRRLLTADESPIPEHKNGTLPLADTWYPITSSGTMVAIQVHNPSVGDYANARNDLLEVSYDNKVGYFTLKQDGTSYHSCKFVGNKVWLRSNNADTNYECVVFYV